MIEIKETLCIATCFKQQQQLVCSLPDNSEWIIQVCFLVVPLTMPDIPATSKYKSHTAQCLRLQQKHWVIKMFLIIWPFLPLTARQHWGRERSFLKRVKQHLLPVFPKSSGRKRYVHLSAVLFVECMFALLCLFCIPPSICIVSLVFWIWSIVSSFLRLKAVLEKKKTTCILRTN